MQRDAIRYFESVNVDPSKQTAVVAESKSGSIGTLTLKVGWLCRHTCSMYPSLSTSATDQAHSHCNQCLYSDRSVYRSKALLIFAEVLAIE